MPQYKFIAGERYERDLLELADEFTKSKPSLDKDAAKKIWEQAMDGKRVTETERRTIEYIMENYKILKPAMGFFEERLAELAGGKSASTAAKPAEKTVKKPQYYKWIKGVSYDRKLLEEAEAMKASHADAILVVADVMNLWAKAHDGRGVTEVEKRTLHLIRRDYRIALDAEKAFDSVLGKSPSSSEPAESGVTTSGSNAPRRGGVEGRPGAKEASSGGVATALAEQVNAAVAGKRKIDGQETAGEDTTPSTKRGRKQADGGLLPLPIADSARADELRESLAPALQDLLGERPADGGEMLAIEWDSAFAPCASADSDAEEDSVAKVDRILALRRASDVLGGGTKEQRLREFSRIAHSLHPDTGKVDAGDDRARVALELAVRAKDKIEDAD